MRWKVTCHVMVIDKKKCISTEALLTNQVCLIKYISTYLSSYEMKINILNIYGSLKMTMVIIRPHMSFDCRRWNEMF